MLNIYFIDRDRRWNGQRLFIAEFTNKQICNAFNLSIPDGLGENGTELSDCLFDEEWECGSHEPDLYGFYADYICKQNGIQPHLTFNTPDEFEAFNQGIEAIAPWLDDPYFGVGTYRCWCEDKSNEFASYLDEATNIITEWNND